MLTRSVLFVSAVLSTSTAHLLRLWIVTGRLSLDEEALCGVSHAEQIGALRIGG